MSILPRIPKHEGALRALLLLALWAGVGVLAPALHQFGHAGHHEHASEAGPGVTAGCPEDCNAPGHGHSPHRLATCHICHAFHAPALVQSVAACAPIACECLRVEPISLSRHVHETTSWASPRGPPSLS